MTLPRIEPLWRVMQDAYKASCADSTTSQRNPAEAEKCVYAAELRAIVTEIRRRWDITLPDESSFHGDTGMEIYHWLIAEADRAELGEGDDTP